MERASITIDGRTTVVLGAPLTLAVNAVDGDKTASSSATVTISVDGISPGSVRTTGNASVSGTAVQSSLAPFGNAKRMEARSPNGLFAVASVKLQRQDGQQYFDLLFGVSGQPELRDSAGQKQRPHITFRPDGNGKFIRLAGTRCELDTTMSYSPVDRAITPEIARVHLHDHQEILELEFSSAPGVDSQVVLEDIRFSNAQ